MVQGTAQNNQPKNINLFMPRFLEQKVRNESETSTFHVDVHCKPMRCTEPKRPTRM